MKFILRFFVKQLLLKASFFDVNLLTRKKFCAILFSY